MSEPRSVRTKKRLIWMTNFFHWLNQLTHQLMDRRNQVLKEYLLRQEVPEKCIRISTATAEKLVAYKGKNQYTIGLVFAGDEPDPELIAEETEN